MDSSHAHMHESASLLLGDGVRFLLSAEKPHLLLEGNAAFTELTSLSPIIYRGRSLSCIFSDCTDSELLEATIMDASLGSESTCGVVLTSQEVLVQIHCAPVFHSAYQVCIMCVATVIAPPTHCPDAAAMVHPDAPFALLSANSDWCALFGGDALGSIEQLCGPLSEADAFAALRHALRRRACLDVDAVAHRRDPVAAEMDPAVADLPPVRIQGCDEVDVLEKDVGRQAAPDQDAPPAPEGPAGKNILTNARWAD